MHAARQKHSWPEPPLDASSHPGPTTTLGIDPWATDPMVRVPANAPGYFKRGRHGATNPALKCGNPAQAASTRPPAKH